jgi:hypothetical protein
VTVGEARKQTESALDALKEHGIKVTKVSVQWIPTRGIPSNTDDGDSEPFARVILEGDFR